MKCEMIKCNVCKKITGDIHDEIGWITIEGMKQLTVSGGRRKDKCADTFRFVSPIQDDIHFCSMVCLLDYIYLEHGHFNNSETMTLSEKLKSIEDDETKEELGKITSNIKEIIEKLLEGKVRIKI